MRDRMDQMTGAVSLGLLADETVLAIGRLLRSEPLGERERQTLAAAGALLRALGDAEIKIIPPHGPQRLHSDATNSAVFKAARLQAPNEPARAVFMRYSAALEKAVETSEFDVDTCRHLQDLFGRVGELTLAHTADLASARRREFGDWTQSKMSAIS